jgi:hypothetical protein
VSTRSYIDYARSRCLCDVGMPGYVAVTAVDTDGDTDLVLVDESALGCEGHNAYDPTCAAAPHEQSGPLPQRFRSRLLATPLRCGRRTKGGAPCRTPVAEPGRACAWHRTAERTMP